MNIDKRTMTKPVLPKHEAERLAVLHSYHILDTVGEKDFDDLTTLAAAICGTPVALVSLVDKDRQWFKSHKGIDATETPIDQSFCAHAILSTADMMVVEDAQADERFKNNPLVTGEPNIVFYAGVPLTNHDGHSLGTLCVIDSKKKILTAEQQEALRVLARQVMDKLELRKKMLELEASEQRISTINGSLTVLNEALLQTQAHLSETNSKLIASEHTLQLAIASANLGMWSLNFGTGQLNVSARFREMFGLSPDQPIHVDAVMHAIDPDYREMAEQAINDAASKLQETDIQYSITHQLSGEKKWIRGVGKVVTDEQGIPKEFIGTNTDITRERELLLQKDEFLGVVSHELKTPITSLKASLELLNMLKDTPGNPMLPKLIDTSTRSMEKINSLVDDLLNMRSFEEGQLRLEKTTFTVYHMLHTCCNHVRIAGNYELIIEGDKELQIVADEHRIDQVVVNFVNNAVKYAPDSPKIYLIVSQENGYAKIAVKDFGPGIPADQLPHLFDRYWRASHSSRKYSGLGLGLFICAEIIKRHGGKIGVESEVGKGSVFWFTLPLNNSAK